MHCVCGAVNTFINLSAQVTRSLGVCVSNFSMEKPQYEIRKFCPHCGTTLINFSMEGSMRQIKFWKSG